MNRKKWTATEKMAVVMDMLKGNKTLSQISKEYGIKDSMAYRWRDEALEAMQGAFTDKRHPKNRPAEADRERLLKIIGEQAVALEFQKKILVNISH